MVFVFTLSEARLTENTSRVHSTLPARAIKMSEYSFKHHVASELQEDKAKRQSLTKNVYGWINKPSFANKQVKTWNIPVNETSWKCTSNCLTILYTRGLQTTARGPNPACKALPSGPQSHFICLQRQCVKNENIIYLQTNCWFGRAHQIPKQSHCGRCLAMELLWSSLCGPLTKKFGDPCSMPLSALLATEEHSPDT